MRPPRWWLVWMLVVGVGLGGIGVTNVGAGVACAGRGLVLPIEVPTDQSGDPDVPTGPGQRQCDKRWSHVVLVVVATPLGPWQCVPCARAPFELTSRVSQQMKGGRQ